MRLPITLVAALIAAPLAAQKPSPMATDSLHFESRPSDGQYRAAIDSLARLDPEEAALSAWRSGDKRLLGIQGYTVMLPSVPSDRYQAARKEFGVRNVEWTSDATFGHLQRNWIEAAYHFATAYNRTMLKQANFR